MRISARFLTRAAAVAALYAAFTLLLAPISFGPLQFRVSEALTVLPIFLVEAVPGLFVGCLIANLLLSATVFDIVFGSLATLLAACLTRRLRNRPALALLPPVLVNAVVIGLILSLTLENTPFLLTALTVGVGQLGACYGLGYPLSLALRKINFRKS